MEQAESGGWRGDGRRGGELRHPALDDYMPLWRAFRCWASAGAVGSAMSIPRRLIP